MVISLNPEDWSHRRLCDGSRLPALASSLVTAESEIAAGRIALFTPRRTTALVTVALTRLPVRLFGLSIRRSEPPRLSSGTLALCSPDFPLTDLYPPATIPLLLKHANILRCARLIERRAWRFPSCLQYIRRRVWQGKRRAMLAVQPTWCRRGDLNSHGVTPTTP